MTDLKQRLSDKKDEISNKYASRTLERSEEFSLVSKSFKAGFDILAPQIVELVEALEESVKSYPNDLQHHTKAYKSLEKFNKFLDEK
jgi:hypothetical protein